MESDETKNNETMSREADWLERLVQVEPPQQSEVIQEYDQRFRKQPRIWSEPEHDEYVFGVLQRFCADLGRPLAGELLDLGCGNGHTLRYFATRTKAALNLSGIDFSPEAVKIAKSQLDNPQLYCADFLTWETDSKFEFIISLGVFEHFRDPRAALRKAATLLKDEGVFYLDVPHCLWHGWSGRREGFRRHWGGSEQLEWHLHRSSWERLIAEANLSVLTAIRGPTPWTEFAWLLSPTLRAPGIQCPQLKRFCADSWRANRRRRLRHFKNIQKRRVKGGLHKALKALGLLAVARKFTKRI